MSTRSEANNTSSWQNCGARRQSGPRLGSRPLRVGPALGQAEAWRAIECRIDGRELPV